MGAVQIDLATVAVAVNQAHKGLIRLSGVQGRSSARHGRSPRKNAIITSGLQPRHPC